MDPSDYQVISQCDTLKRSVVLCIDDEVYPMATFEVLPVCLARIAFSSFIQ